MKILTGSKNPLSSSLYALALGLAPFALSGSFPAQAQTPSCTQTVQYEFQGRVNKNHSISFSADVLKQLQGLQIESATLELELVGRHHENRDVSLSINGIITAKHDGSCRFRSHDRDSDRDDFHWQGWMRLDEFLLNGSVRFRDQFWRLIDNHGALEVRIEPEDLKVVSATLVITAVVSGPSCGPSPSPSPSPVPVPPAPTTSILSVSPSASLTNSTTIQFTLGSDQSGVTYLCSLDGAAPANCSSPQSYSGLTNGQHGFSVVSTNAFGETDPAGAQYAWTVDTTPPTVSIGSVVPSSQLTNSTTISIAFSGSTSGTFSCSLDGAAGSPCTSPVSYAALMQGTHTVSISETDLAGNVSGTPAVYQWQVDLTPPVAQFVQVSPANTPNNSTSMTFTFSANKTATFSCALDSAAAQTCTSPFSVSQLTAGAHDFAIQPTDAAGNVGAVVDYTWTADFTPPNITLGNVVPAPGLTNATNVSVEFTADKPVSFTCSLDGAAAAPCVSPFTSPITTAGAHNVTIGATDMAGNVATPASVSWTMDYTLPMISLGTILPSASSFINSTTLTVSVNATEPVTFTSSLNGVDLGQTSSPISLTGLTEGQYTLTLNAVDGAGNPSNTINYTFNVDLQSPAVTIGAAKVSGLTNQTSNSIAFSATDPDPAETVSFQCNFDNAGYTACTSPFTVSGLANGTHVLSVIGTDLAGNASSPAAFSWAVDTIAPKTTIQSVTPSGSVINQTSVSVAFSVSETATSACSVDNGAFASCTSPFAASGLANGSHTIQIQSTDVAGNVEPTPATYTFSVDTTPITVSITGSPATLTDSTQAIFSFTSNKPSAVFTCSLDGNTQAGCTSPVTYNGLANGNHTFSLGAHDAAGNVATPITFAWTIDTTSPVTTLVSETPSASLTNSTTMSIAFSVSKANSTSKCTLDSGTPVTCSSPYAMSSLSNGSHTIVIQSTDALGNVEVNPPSYTWSVDMTPPVTSIQASQAANQGNSITFTLVSSKPNSTFVCAMDGATAAPCSSTMSYSGLSAGSHSFYADATDAAGNVDPTGATYSFQVVPPLSTTITSITPSANPTNQTSITFAFTSNVNGASFLCSFNGAAATACASPMTYSGLANGSYTFAVYSTYGGMTDPTGASYAWTVDTTVPIVTSASVTVTATSATITWTTSEPTTTGMAWGAGQIDSNLIPQNSTYVTTHTLTLTNLTPSTAYSYIPEGQNQAGTAVTQSKHAFKTLSN